MIAIFTRATSISSFLIRLVTWSRWSHVAMVQADSIDNLTEHTPIIDSTFLHKGVKKRTLGELLKPASVWAYVEVPVLNEDLAWVAAHSQIGKPYDWKAALGIFFHRNWDTMSDWFCNELFEWSLKQGGSPRFIESLSRLTPQHSWMLKTPKLPVVRSKKDGFSV